MPASLRLLSPPGLVLPLCALVLSGCAVSQSSYDEMQANLQQAQTNNQKLQAENASLRAQIGQDQQRMFTIAADLLFAPAGFDVTANGQTLLHEIAGKLANPHGSKIVVYGYSDDTKIGPSLKKQGVETNVDLSSRRADSVVHYLVSQGVDASRISSKGRGDTHPVAPNDNPAGRAQNRRIEIVVEGPGN